MIFYNNICVKQLSIQSIKIASQPIWMEYTESCFKSVVLLSAVVIGITNLAINYDGVNT